MGDCDEFAKRNLTVKQYEKLQAISSNLPLNKKKQRFLIISDINKMLDKLFKPVGKFFDSFVDGVKQVVTSDSGPAFVAGTVGTLAIIKNRREARFKHKSKLLIKSADNTQYFASMLRTIVDKLVLCAGMLDKAIVTTSSIDKNVGFRFNKKCQEYGGGPY